MFFLDMTTKKRFIEKSDAFGRRLGMREAQNQEFIYHGKRGKGTSKAHLKKR